MSVAIGHRSAGDGRRRPNARAPIALRLRVFLRRGVLDRLLAAGADPSWDDELALRARQVTAPRRRRGLAEGFVRAMNEAHHPPRWTCAAPLARHAVRATTPELRALAAGLCEETAPAPQGITLAEQLLREPGSPLYAPGDESALREGVQLACEALTQSQSKRGEVMRPADGDVGRRDFRFGATGLLLMIAAAIAFAIFS